jgi:sarcosine oxidase subunit gamma
MSEPIMQTPLHAFDLARQTKPRDDSKGVWANEVAPLGFVSLRGNGGDEAFVAAVSGVLGCPLPVSSCTYSVSSKSKVLWLSPDEWMIVCPRDGLSGLLSGLTQALAGIRSQVADNSGGYTLVWLTGDKAQDVLAHVSVYDVTVLTPGRVVGTTFGKASVYLHREGSGYLLMLRRSFADYIWRYLVRAAQPYGFGVVAVAGDALGLEKGAA